MRSIYAVICSDWLDERHDRWNRPDPGGQVNLNVAGTSISFPLPGLPLPLTERCHSAIMLDLFPGVSHFLDAGVCISAKEYPCSEKDAKL
jgi:hypothetical protein